MLVYKVSPWNRKVTESDIHWLYGCGTMINITFPAVLSPFNRGGAFWHMTSILYGTFTTSLSSFYCHFPLIIHQLILVFVALVTMLPYGEREMQPINWLIVFTFQTQPNTGDSGSEDLTGHKQVMNASVLLGCAFVLMVLLHVSDIY